MAILPEQRQVDSQTQTQHSTQPQPPPPPKPTLRPYLGTEPPALKTPSVIEPLSWDVGEYGVSDANCDEANEKYLLENRQRDVGRKRDLGVGAKFDWSEVVVRKVAEGKKRKEVKVPVYIRRKNKEMEALMEKWDGNYLRPSEKDFEEAMEKEKE